jgi:hypothetical protein
MKTVRPPRTLLQTEMKSLVGKLVYVAIFFSTLIPLIGIFRGQDLKNNGPHWPFTLLCHNI